MSEIEVYQPRELAVAAPVVAEMDSWIAVCSDVIKVANVICDTPFVPDGLRGSGPAVAAAILAGRELSLGPMTSLANIHVIKGKPALSAVLMRALVLAQGHQWEDVDVTDTRAVIRGKRRGEAEWTTVSFTADQAHKAKIDLGGYPQDKLYARATSRLARRKFADVIAGMPYSAEELEDGTDGDVILAGESYKTEVKPAAEPEKPRTAQRRTRTQTPAAQVSEPPAQIPEPAPLVTTQPELPPLPGEDEPDPTGAATSAAPTTPATSSSGKGNGKVGICQAHFRRLGFTEDDKAERLGAAAAIAGLPEGQQLASLNDLDDQQLSAVADTLSRCRDKGALIALLAAEDTTATAG